MGKPDITHKSFFENAEWFADLMNAAFFGGEQILDADELLPEDGAVRKADTMITVERLRDVVKKQTKEGITYAVYVLENQTTVDYAMLVRIMVEESLLYDKQVKKIRKQNKERYENKLKDDEYIGGFQSTDQLVPVFTLVVYWGDKVWDAKTDLRDLVSIPPVNPIMQKRMRDLISNYQIKVFDLNKVEDFSAFKTTLRTVFEFYSYRRNKEGLKEYLEKHQTEVKLLDEESRFLLSTIVKEKRLLKQLKMTDMSQENDKEDKNMCQAIQEMIDDGREEGIQIGRAESIIFILNQKGSLSENVLKRINDEKNNDILKKWLLLAINAECISDFEKEM